MTRFVTTLAGLVMALAPLASAQAVPPPTWPNGPDEDPRLAPPNDPGFGGQWNLWSYVPEAWQATPGFRAQEIAMGTGIHADRAWQVTTGDRRVIVAVHDSGCYFDNRDLVNKYYLNRGELAGCKPTPLASPPAGADEFDVNGDASFDIRDYWAAAGTEAAALADWDENENGMIDPQDLIRKCSDGVDSDGNGYIDDISGWDFYQDDNDP
ncbi:MAG: alkaline serine protease, partial [Myxococcales bacterium]|nr:alkaline serine protease [Myxococcales bacterium]